jgi:hypothetical protein
MKNKGFDIAMPMFMMEKLIVDKYLDEFSLDELKVILYVYRNSSTDPVKLSNKINYSVRFIEHTILKLSEIFMKEL